MSNINVTIPREFVVAQGNAFWLDTGTVFAAPVLSARGAADVEWTEAVEVERTDDNQGIFDAVYRVLDAIALTAAIGWSNS